MLHGSLLSGAVAMLLLSGAAWADTLADVAGRYAIAPSSAISFSVGQVGGGGISGKFPKFSGTIELDPGNIGRSRVTFTLAPGSVTTGEARVEKFLRSDAVFDAAAYPSITFRSIRVTQLDSSTAAIDGILAARGKSRQERFTATLVKYDGRNVTFHVVGDVLRSPYGMDVGTPIYSNVVKFDMIVQGRKF
ncbi:YceI family protein [Paramesorhizobium deserti]|nr:YceI family protein [Paramesorhizobium deserti]